MADRTTAPADALALEARPLLPPRTRPGRVKDARAAAPGSVVPGDDPLYPVYTPKVPQSPFHAETLREFASDLLVHLRQAFRDRPHTLANDVNLYYEDPRPPSGRVPGRQSAPVVPDFMLFLRPIELSRFRSYRTWEVGVPAWVLEILSDDTWENDVGDKRDLYARLGVAECWFYDPEGVQHEDSAGTLTAFRLRAGVYEAIAPARHPADGAVAAVYPSAVLGVALGVDRQRHLRLYDAGRQAWYQTADEAQAEAQAERDARQQAEAQAQDAAEQAQAERDARQQAEAQAQDAAEQAQAERDARQQAEAQAQAERDARQQAEAQAQAERDARQQAEARLQELLARLPTSNNDELDSPCP